MRQFFGHPVSTIVFSAFLLGGVALCIFTPDLFVLKRGADFTVQIMLGYLLFGMLLLVLGRDSLMLVSFASCAILCLHLKRTSYQSLRLASPTDEPKVALAMINLSLSDDFEVTSGTIDMLTADLMLFQEYSPGWDDYLREKLRKTYPYQVEMTRIDPYGMAWYSRYPIVAADTFLAGGIPNLYVAVEPQKNKPIHFVSLHTFVPVNTNAYREIRNHLREVTRHVQSLDGPLVVAGDFNLPSWANEVRDFKQQAQLHDSRRDIVPASMQGSVSFFKVPVDHIFFTADLECTDFRVITGARDSHLGIYGCYQLVRDTDIGHHLRIR